MIETLENSVSSSTFLLPNFGLHKVGYSWKRSYELNQNGKFFVPIHIVNPWIMHLLQEKKIEDINKNMIFDA